MRKKLWFKKSFSFAILLFAITIVGFALTGCGTMGTSRIDEAYDKFEELSTPPHSIKRTADMPLVAAIPGLGRDAARGFDREYAESTVLPAVAARARWGVSDRL